MQPWRRMSGEPEAEKRRASTSRQPAASATPSARICALAWNSGIAQYTASSAVALHMVKTAPCAMSARRPWPRRTAFGPAVVPEVKRRSARSSSPTEIPGSVVRCPASARSRDDPAIMVRRPGSPGRPVPRRAGARLDDIDGRHGRCRAPVARHAGRVEPHHRSAGQAAQLGEDLGAVLQQEPRGTAGSDRAARGTGGRTGMPRRVSRRKVRSSAQERAVGAWVGGVLAEEVGVGHRPRLPARRTRRPQALRAVCRPAGGTQTSLPSLPHFDRLAETCPTIP